MTPCTASSPFKMASSSAGRILQTVRKHVPSIRFPRRIKQVTESDQASRINPPEISATLSAISKRTLPTETMERTSVDFLSRGASNVDDVYSYESLPARYRRRPLAQDEIEYIERGGPE